MSYKKGKTYFINTNLNIYEIDENYKNIITEERKKVNNIKHYISYLKNFYDYQISEMEIERILNKIEKIRIITKKRMKNYCLKEKEKIMIIIYSNIYFYKKKTNDKIVTLYKTIYLGQPAVVKVYKYLPEFIFSKSLIEEQFETEIVFQIYAESLNMEYNFVSPKIYSFGIINEIGIDDLTEINYAFIIMEYIDGISLKNIDFRPDVCKQIYNIDENLKKNLLNHNDIKDRNIIITENNDIAILDYGESSYSI